MSDVEAWAEVARRAEAVRDARAESGRDTSDYDNLVALAKARAIAPGVSHLPRDLGSVRVIDNLIDVSAYFEAQHASYPTMRTRMIADAARHLAIVVIRYFWGDPV